ncbi:MAG: GNAT family N-acetyltransferase [Thermoleophilia bacterium]|nr:GNAT family N-acetyltransferase [Thermoleophilia bacterium]
MIEMVAAGAVDVILRDGTTLRLRPPAAGDVESLTAFFEGLSDESRRLRFHGGVAVTPRLVEPMLGPDWESRGALVGELEGEIVACASYVRLRDPGAAESAFAVADEHQGRGIGTRLLEQLAARAEEVGIERFLAVVLPENARMIHVFEHVGFSISRHLDQGAIEVEFPLAPTEAYRAAVDERDHVAVTASLRPFFEPRSVAVVGASRRRETIGGRIFRNVVEGDFAGAAYPVNRDGTPVAGVRGYRSVAEIPDPVDLAVLALPAVAVLPAAEDALRSGVRALVVVSAGFAEVGSDGAERERQLLELVRSHGGRLIGPNCLGVSSASVALNATFAGRGIPPGNIGFSSQSGALGLALLEAADQRGLGLSSFVSIGNKADVSTNDLLEWWEDDEPTGLVLMYVESFGNPRRFARLAQRVARRKPVLALKSGTTATGARAASSHTAALAGSEAAVDALFRQAGVIRARTLDELVDVAGLLSSQPTPRGRRVAVLTNAGGLGILAADACEAAGLMLPPVETARLRELLPAEASVANPVDMLGSATPETYARVLPVLLEDPGVDAVIALFVPAAQATADAVAREIAAAAAGAEKPVLAVVLSAVGVPGKLRGAVAAFTSPEAAARALGRAAERADWLRRPLGSVPELDGVDREAAAGIVDGADEGWLDPARTRALLEAYGIPLVPERLANGPDDAVAAAHELGFPVVVKTAAAGAHKTETGGVALDLAGDEAVRAAAGRMGGPVLVQRMVGGGTELLAGLVQDPTFGPLVAFGPGGVLAELIGEASFRIAPLTDVDADELLSAGKAGLLVAGFRGAPPADRAPLADLLHRLARLGEDLPAVAELDLNPVLALPEGCVAVDARVRVRRPEARPRTKSW